MEADRVRRFYAVLSRINRLIVRVKEAHRLAQEACEVAVHDGQFTLAWVGKCGEITSHVEVFAFAGVGEDYLRTVDIDLADPERNQGPTGTAILTGDHVVCNDIEAEVAMGPWKAEARRLGSVRRGRFPSWSATPSGGPSTSTPTKQGSSTPTRSGSSTSWPWTSALVWGSWKRRTNCSRPKSSRA